MTILDVRGACGVWESTDKGGHMAIVLWQQLGQARTCEWEKKSYAPSWHCLHPCCPTPAAAPPQPDPNQPPHPNSSWQSPAPAPLVLALAPKCYRNIQLHPLPAHHKGCTLSLLLPRSRAGITQTSSKVHSVMLLAPFLSSSSCILCSTPCSTVF